MSIGGQGREGGTEGGRDRKRGREGEGKQHSEKQDRYALAVTKTNPNFNIQSGWLDSNALWSLTNSNSSPQGTRNL